MSFLLWAVLKLVDTKCIDRRTYCITSVTLIQSQHSRINGNYVLQRKKTKSSTCSKTFATKTQCKYQLREDMREMPGCLAQ